MKKIISLTLILLLLVSCSSPDSNKSSTSDVDNRIAELESENSRLQSEISSMSESIKELENSVSEPEIIVGESDYWIPDDFQQTEYYPDTDVLTYAIVCELENVPPYTVSTGNTNLYYYKYECSQENVEKYGEYLLNTGYSLFTSDVKDNSSFSFLYANEDFTKSLLIIGVFPNDIGREANLEICVTTSGK